MGIKFGGKQTVKDKMKVAESRVGKSPGASKGIRPPPKPTFKVRPTGGLKPDGFKVKAPWKF